MLLPPLCNSVFIMLWKNVFMIYGINIKFSRLGKILQENQSWWKWLTDWVKWTTVDRNKWVKSCIHLKIIIWIKLFIVNFWVFVRREHTKIPTWWCNGFHFSCWFGSDENQFKIIGCQHIFSLQLNWM